MLVVLFHVWDSLGDLLFNKTHDAAGRDSMLGRDRGECGRLPLYVFYFFWDYLERVKSKDF